MCGIIGIVGRHAVTDRLVQGLKRLEYRGYDSAGIAVLNGEGLVRRRAEGKLANLQSVLADAPVDGVAGIGHTRWATHGAPSERNAHPHTGEGVAVVHNGIIENFRALREELAAQGVACTTDTDTEVIAHLIALARAEGLEPLAATRAVLDRLEGAFALAVLFRGHENFMIGARRGSPLAVGYGDGEMYLGSDAIALASLTHRVTFLEDGDHVVLSAGEAQFFDRAKAAVQRSIVDSTVDAAAIDKGNYRHFMQKEIFEQPTVITETLARYLDLENGRVTLPGDLGIDFSTVPKLTIVACGTAYYAAFVARYWFEQVARMPVEVDIASEFRYRDPVLPNGGVALFISQSGETADTLAALDYCKRHGQLTVGVVNVPESSMAREADKLLPTKAGPEIGVASTKAFTCQLAVLAALSLYAGRQRGVLEAADEAARVQILSGAASRMAEMLNDDAGITRIARDVGEARSVLYLGRGQSFPLALEGALKLKEISYIHAEGYAAGEMKHGPIALIDKRVPVVAVAPPGPLFEKTLSNVQEAAARGGQIILMSSPGLCASYRNDDIRTIAVPEVDPFVAPLVYAVPLQRLAYEVAVAKGTDVDQPRNLAKSVTVE